MSHYPLSTVKVINLINLNYKKFRLDFLKYKICKAIINYNLLVPIYIYIFLYIEMLLDILYKIYHNILIYNLLV